MRKKISIYVRNQYLTPSSYYRIIQYAKNFDGDIVVNDIAPKNMYEKNIRLDKNKKILYLMKSIHYYLTMVIRATIFIIRDTIYNPDYIIVSKVILPKYMPRVVCIILKYLTQKSTLYWDFDDLLFNKNERISKQHLILGNNSKNIIVTNRYLKDSLLDEWKDKCILLPTTDGDLQGIDLDKLNIYRKKIYNNKIVLVWVATNSSMPYLDRIMSSLEETAKEIYYKYNKKLVLKVVCNSKVNCKKGYLNVENIEWTRERAIEEIHKAHIGIMPLIKNNFTLGKGGFKLIQYMSAGLPIIASNVGFNKEVVSEEYGILVNDENNTREWKHKILEISDNWDMLETMSYESYKTWNEKFSYNKNLEFWQSMING